MSTRPCPHCHEIIPTDLDYCPYCNQSTRESLQTAEDAALCQRNEMAAAAEAAGATATVPPDSVSEQGTSGIPLRPSIDRCMMCMMAPATVGEYCLDCRNKLDMGPEQWDLVKQDNSRRNAIVVIAVVAVLLVLIVLIAHARHPANAPTATSAPGSKPAGS